MAVLSNYSRELNEGITLDSIGIESVKQLEALPDDYVWMIKFSNGLIFKRITLVETYDSDELGFCLYEFFNWEEALSVTVTLNEALAEFDLSLPYERLLYIGSTVEDKGILLGTEIEVFGNVFLFSPTRMVEQDDTVVPIHKLADSLEEFLLKLEPEPF